ncbi:MAG: glycosyltransferase family 4 protein [Acidimicrobiia bacterium]|nr:glycosyltransferase family 4 protein [Acidimicrobiia bacterium]
MTRTPEALTPPVESLAILVLCPHYLPDTAPTGEVMAGLCERWIAQGHRVEIVTSLPWYSTHAVDHSWRGKLVRTQPEVWGRIRRWYPFPSKKIGMWRRAVSMIGFTWLVGMDAVAASRRCDVVFVMSPPLTLGIAGQLAVLGGRAPLVFNVQDIFPDAAVLTGVLKNKQIVALVNCLERWLYRRADAVTVLSENMATNVRAKLSAGVARDKVVVIPNSVDSKRIIPQERNNWYRAELGFTETNTASILVMYAGNLGHSQPLDLVVDAAQRFAVQGRRDICFVINGDGVGRQRIAAAAERCPNLHLVAGWQPRERLSEVLAAADVHLVLLHAGLGAASVPSKVYSVLAAGRPVLASVDRGSEVERLLRVSGAGVSVEPNNLDAFCEALVHMADDPDCLRKMGEQARAYLEAMAGPEQIADQYLGLFAQLLCK